MNFNFSLSEKEMEEIGVSSQNIFDGIVLHVRKDTVTLPNGKQSTREYCHHNGAVCVIPVTREGEVVCVRQYRYAMHEPMLEIPAGKLDTPDENPNDAVRRELREETGATAAKLTKLGIYYASPAILDEKIHMYLAEDLSFGDTDPDEDEFLEIVKAPLAALAQAVLDGKITDGKTQVCVLRAYMMLADEYKLPKLNFPVLPKNGELC